MTWQATRPSPSRVSRGKDFGDREGRHSEVMAKLENLGRQEVRQEIRRAIAALQLAQEILTGLAGADGGRTTGLLRERASALGTGLTRAELDSVSRFLEGQPPEDIAEERGLSSRTVSNQIRSGCRKLEFGDRRELKGWWAAARGFILTKPPED